MTGPPPKSPLFPSPPLSRPHDPPLVRREHRGRRGGQPGERIAQRGHALDAGEPLRHEPIQYRGGDLQLVDERSEEHTSELQSPCNLVCRLLLEKKKKTTHDS